MAAFRSTMFSLLRCNSKGRDEVEAVFSGEELISLMNKQEKRVWGAPGHLTLIKGFNSQPRSLITVHSGISFQHQILLPSS
jgi:hypothetical protein